MYRVINFSSGPAALPVSVLQRAAAEMLDWRGSGMSVMEMSHRGPEFTEILANTQMLIRQLLGVPENYAVLLLQGGAIAENAIVPMNLMGRTGSADYVLSGVWSEKSMLEAAKYG
jgi:phosphoserine aminotransferase